MDRIAHIPHKLTYLLPCKFDGSIAQTFVTSTSTSDPKVNNILKSARDKPFISYDDDFLALLGPDPKPELIEERDSNFAGEAGVWIPERDEVWYTTWINDGPTRIEILDLRTRTTRKLVSSRPIENPNGGYYHKGVIYFTCIRDDSRGWPGGVVSVDPASGRVETILNSYFGLKFDVIDDVAWVTKPGTDEDYMFITILPLPDGAGNPDDTLPQGLWRWDPRNKLLLPAISRTEYPVANGVRPSKDGRALWLTDFGGEERSRVWGFPARVGSPAVYRYDLDGDMWPVNKRIFAVARMQAPDGIRVDEQGRVWTAEGEGVLVRSAVGKVIGVFNAHYFTRDPVKTAIVQFELAGDVLIILGQNKLWTIKLAEVVNRG
jgi:gluconolactonase